MKIILSLLLFVCLTCVACSQTVRNIDTLPSNLAENSGILVSNSNRYWVHNDGGDGSRLYLLDTLGNILRTVTVQNATNVDWEDITADQNGYLYIGDIGNNNNNRQNLRIYKLPHPDGISSDTLQAEVIRFHYPEQSSFPASNLEKKYDAEALIYFHDSLYIFTKDRTSPHQGYTWLYQIPADTGSHAAILLDSFPTQQLSYIFEVTAAAITDNGEHVALLGANRVWIFSNFPGRNFFDGMISNIPLGSVDQKEALDFVSPQQLYITNESSILGAARLRSLDLGNLLLNIIDDTNTLPASNITIYPNPVIRRYSMTLALQLNEPIALNLSLLDATGKVARVYSQMGGYVGVQRVTLSTDRLPAGLYYLQLTSGKARYIKRIVIR